jgi:hypothetical protein
MIDSAKALGAQLLAAIEPIVSALGPVISAITDKLTEAAGAVAQFVAKASGNDTYVKATKGQSDYAASLDKTTSSTNKANEAAKEYKNTVLGFDQLNKLDAQDETTSTIGIDEASLANAETEATALNAIADEIRAAYEKGNFVGVGKGVAKGLAYITKSLADTVGWNKNKDKIKGVLTNVADTINGFSEGLIESGAQIGENVADIANAVINGADVLLTRIDGLKLGEGIGSILDSAINNIEWETLGADIINGLELAVDFVTGILNTGILGDLGVAISDTIHGMIQAIDPEKWADALDAIVNGIFDFFANISISHTDAS